MKRQANRTHVEVEKVLSGRTLLVPWIIMTEKQDLIQGNYQDKIKREKEEEDTQLAKSPKKLMRQVLVVLAEVRKGFSQVRFKPYCVSDLHNIKNSKFCHLKDSFQRSSWY